MSTDEGPPPAAEPEPVPSSEPASEPEPAAEPAAAGGAVGPSSKPPPVAIASDESPTSIWHSLGIEAGPSDMSQYARSQAVAVEGAITSIGRHVNRVKMETAKQKGQLNETKATVAVHTADIDSLKLLCGDETAMKKLLASFEELKDSMLSENARLAMLLEMQQKELSRLTTSFTRVEGLPPIIDTMSLQVKRLEIRVDKIEPQLPPDFGPLWAEIGTLQSGVEGCEMEIQQLHARSNDLMLSVMADEAVESVVDTIRYTDQVQDYAANAMRESSMNNVMETTAKAASEAAEQSPSIVDSVAALSHKLSRRTSSRMLAREVGTKSALHENTADKIYAGSCFYRWRDVIFARREQGLATLAAEEDQNIPDEFEWDKFAAAQVVQIAMAQHADFAAEQEQAAQTERVRLAAEKRQELASAEGGDAAAATPLSTPMAQEDATSAAGDGRYVPRFPSTQGRVPSAIPEESASEADAVAGSTPVSAPASPSTAPGGSSGAMAAVGSLTYSHSDHVHDIQSSGDADCADSSRLQDHVSMKVHRKVEQRIGFLHLQHQNGEMVTQLAVLAKGQADDHSMIDGHTQDIEKIYAELSRLDELAKAAMDMARRAAEAAAGMMPGESAIFEASNFDEEKQKLADLEKALAELRERSDAADDKHDTMLEAHEGQLELLKDVTHRLDEVQLEELSKKADQVPVDKIKLDIDEILKRLEDMSGMLGMTPEMEEALAMLRSMREIKKMIAAHAIKLADLFTNKASNDDVEKTVGLVQVRCALLLRSLIASHALRWACSFG